MNVIPWMRSNEGGFHCPQSQAKRLTLTEVWHWPRLAHVTEPRLGTMKNPSMTLSEVWRSPVWRKPSSIVFLFCRAHRATRTTHDRSGRRVTTGIRSLCIFCRHTFICRHFYSHSVTFFCQLYIWPHRLIFLIARHLQ